MATQEPREIKRYCNCAECNKQLLSPQQEHLATAKEECVAGRIHGRPYCEICLTIAGQGPVRQRGRDDPDEEPAAAQETSVRAMEDSLGDQD